jgi:hypothetical protein
MMTERQMGNDKDVADELRRTIPSLNDMSDEELLHASDGTFTQAAARLAIAWRSLWESIKKEFR